MNCFIDTNLLIYAIQKKSQFHQASINFIAKHNCYLSDQVCLEFINVCLHLNIFTYQTAIEQLDFLLSQKNIVLIHPKLNTFELWRLLNDNYQLSKRYLFDSYLVATMLVNGLSKLATFNQKDFKIFKEIILVGLA